VPALFADARAASSGADGPPSHDDGGGAGRKGAAALPAADVAAAAAEAVAQLQLPPAPADPPAHAPADTDALAATASAGLADAARASAAPSAAHAPASAPAADALPPEVRFASANHENIVTSMRADLLPNGGSMHIRLDPPQLGALQVTVQIRDGQITASFETSSDEATRLLGHSLNQLKTVLETQGVTVDKLQVTQAPREARATSQSHDDGGRDRGGQSPEQEQSARQEQQRRHMLQRMWRRLAGGGDPLDLTA
jgi:flagellar hook-length control protein FliK